MPNDGDLSHINKQIQKDRARIDAAHREAENKRIDADQKRHDGDFDRATYYEHEADRDEHHAMELEDEIDQLESEKERVEKRIAELIEQRTHIDSEHVARLRQIDDEIAHLRGSGMML